MTIPAAKGALGKILYRHVKDEIRNFVSSRHKSVLRNKATVENMVSFKWHSVCEELEQMCPIFSSALNAAATVRPHKTMPNKRREESLDDGIVGLCGSIIAAAHNTNMNLTQHILGLQLWLGGCKREVNIIVFQHGFLNNNIFFLSELSISIFYIIS